MDPNASPKQAILDAEHLRLLAIGYWISTGVHAFASLLGLLYLFMGVVMGTVFKNLPVKDGQTPPPPGLFMALFGGLGLGIFVVMVTWALLNAHAARCLKARKSRTFCLVIGGFNCLSIPWGTALGILTFMVLGRSSVAAMFDAPTAPPSAPSPAPKGPGVPPAP